MTKWLTILLQFLVSLFRTRRDLAFENLLLRQQLAVLKEKGARLQLSPADRSFWVMLSKLWPKWRSVLHVVKPETVIRWHREGFRRHWARKCRKKGRPALDPKIRLLIRRMSRANPLWGAPRIHGELLKLGIDVSETTVAKYLIRERKPPAQSWRTFLDNHAKDIIATDFFTVPTTTFRVLFVLVVLSHDRREILHTNVTEHPTADWTARQIIEAVGLDKAPKYLLRDRDKKFSLHFSRQVASVGLAEVLTAPASPWQNAYAERVVGTIRRECLDHTIILGEQHLRRIIKRYLGYYNGVRTHLSLSKDAPRARPIQFPNSGVIRSRQHCGGLHHEYYRAAA
ncbi:MAG: transposase family protein [Gammaproteobacteria bacterium]|nr:transposase family protein [Gammaproteobacteria bacterium]